MDDYNSLILPILIAFLVGLVVGIRARKGLGWIIVTTLAAGFAGIILLSMLLFGFLVGPMASPALAAFLANNRDLEPLWFAIVALSPIIGSVLTVWFLSRFG